MDSGGLGNDVSLVLRAATLPGAEYVMPVLFGRVPQALGSGAGRLLRLAGIGRRERRRGIREGLHSLDPAGRRAFLHTARSVIDPAGQRVDARDRLYLSEGIPTLLVWGSEDPIIPSATAASARADARQPPGGLRGRGALPHAGKPERFAALLADFVDGTVAARYDEAQVEARLRKGP